MSSSPIHAAAFGALRFVGSRNHGFSPVFTRGYNMPSRWDYCRLKAVLKDQRSGSFPSPA